MRKPEALETRQRRGALSSTIAIAILFLSACWGGSTDSQEFPVTNPGLVAQAESELEHAREAGASEEQIHQLEKIAETGDMGFDDVRLAVERTFACFDDAGVPHSELQGIGLSEFPELYYEFSNVPGLTESQSYEIANGCLNRESFYVERLYWSSPGFEAYLDERFEFVREQVTECLTDAGVVVEPGLSHTEMRGLAVDSAHNGLPVQNCLILLP